MKVIRLKESDIQRMVKRVLNEQQVKPKYERGVSDVMEIVNIIKDRLEDDRSTEREEKLLLSIEKKMGIPEGTILKNMMEDIENGDGRLSLTWKYLRDWEENK